MTEFASSIFIMKNELSPCFYKEHIFNQAKKSACIAVALPTHMAISFLLIAYIVVFNFSQQFAKE